MPVINVRMHEGRTVDQKRALIEGITKVVNETVNAPYENITVFIEDVPFTNLAKAGVLLCDKEK